MKEPVPLPEHYRVLKDRRELKDTRRAMALTAKNEQSPHDPQQPDRAERKNARPFDPRELEKLPLATDDDPPYRPWWVIDQT